MKFLIVFVALLALAAAAPPKASPRASSGDVQLLRSDSEVGPQSFKYGYETSDGSSHNEEGQLKNVGTEQEALVVHGSYSFVGDDGVTYHVKYVADENGFQPEAAHLPVAPHA